MYPKQALRRQKVPNRHSCMSAMNDLRTAAERGSQRERNVGAKILSERFAHLTSHHPSTHTQSEGERTAHTVTQPVSQSQYRVIPTVTVTHTLFSFFWIESDAECSCDWVNQARLAASRLLATPWVWLSVAAAFVASLLIIIL